MHRLAGRGALAALGIASAAAYATSLPIADRPGMEPLAAHVVVFGVLFVLYVTAIRVAFGPAGRARGALGLVLGFGLLFRLQQRVADHGGMVVARGPSPKVRRLMEMTQLNRVIAILD